ncbi:MAG: hypothetical protein QXH07_00790 [Thermoplasmata archaeon]
MDLAKWFGIIALFLIPVIMIILNFTIVPNILLLIIGFSWIGTSIIILTLDNSS